MKTLQKPGGIAALYEAVAYIVGNYWFSRRSECFECG
jgi:hypothetical protein